jgi:glycosyltransferase involved in cell wall biosynthesis/Flp pilus assembly protein TadD
MSTNAASGLASIIIPCSNQLEFTRQCIAALNRHTRRPCELIVIDNGSTDGTAEYLAGVRDMASVPVTVITNRTNRGFPAAINQGLKAARGEYLVLLNNDVVVTEGWLGQLIGLVNAKRGTTAEGAEHAEKRAEDRDEQIVGDGVVNSLANCASDERGSAEIGPLPLVGLACGSARTNPRPTPPDPPFTSEGKGPLGIARAEGRSAGTAIPAQPTDGVAPAVRPIGLVGPMSNYVAPPQLVDSVPYRDFHEMHAFARKWRDEHRGKWFTAHKLSGFCLLMKRDVDQKIGGLDERFGLGFFDDDDLAERARRAGFELAVAQDLFVHHFGSRTFQGNGVDAEKLLDENARRFADKWGLKEAGGEMVALRPWRAADSSWFLSEAQRAFARQVDEPGQESSGSPEPGQRECEETLHTRTRSASAQFRDAAMRAPDRRLSLRESMDPFAERKATLGRRHDNSAASKLASGSGDARAESECRAASVCLNMIVKNEEDHLGKCLESVRGLFDEIIIVDTGSTDRTKEIAREFGAKVFDFVWIDDFAAARNEALSHATGDYAFWLDADDVVEPAEREKLRALLGGLAGPSVCSAAATPHTEARSPDLGPAAYRVVRGSHDPAPDPTDRSSVCEESFGDGGSGDPEATVRGQETLAQQSQETRAQRAAAARSEARSPDDGPTAFVMRCACPPGPEGTRGGTVVDHVRLFPIRPGVRWTYRVHEQILPSLNRAKVKVRWTDVVIRHDGYADPDVEARKLERNIKILERELAERPDDPFVLFNLGASALQRKEHHAALGFLERSLALSAPGDSIVRKLYALIARVHHMTGNSQAALRTCAAGLELDPADAELWHRKAVAHRHRGESSEAERAWRRILDLKRPQQYCSFDDGLYGHITRRNLAVLAAERGDLAEARRLWEAVLAECPGDRQALARLGSGPDRAVVRP